MNQYIAYYFTPDQHIRIKNEKGKTILDQSFPQANNYFTLPHIPIQTQNRLRLIKLIPINWNLLKRFFEIYPPEKKEAPNSIDISADDFESNKACIYPKVGQIFYNRQFLDSIQNLTTRKQVFLHELGHLYYNTEFKCDLFAATILCLLGYPPSEIIRSVERTLDYNPENVNRLHQVINYLIKLQ